MDYTKLAIFSQLRESYDGGQARRYNFVMNLKLYVKPQQPVNFWHSLLQALSDTPFNEFDALHPNNRHFGSQNAVKNKK